MNLKSFSVFLLVSSAWVAMPASVLAAGSEAKTVRGDAMIAEYFRAETKRLADGYLADIRSLEDWKARRNEFRQELFEMLSLAPVPERTELKPVVTGQIEHELFTVEKLHFQSMPGLYVTANLYVPKNLSKPAPAVLYVCGHGPVIKNGISYGNKVAYQHHGSWFARHGYVCLIIDTVQLGEIQGIHHGTYREGMWWWNARGYSSAGAEAWNSIRALDYLQSRPEVDPDRLGVTGRSGGGAYSWWVAALDDRIKVAAPVAGITDLQNHVVDGVVEGHCDCMFIVNTYRWDYPLVAALVAPRPLLICNRDKDSIFPLDGVVRLHGNVAKVYKLYGATDQLGLLITEGPHKDTQDLQLPVLRWFNRHLKGEDPIIEIAARPLFTPEQLKVFDQLPTGERTSKIHETFVPVAASTEAPKKLSDWASLRDSWKKALREKVFRGWPEEVPTRNPAAQVKTEGSGLRLAIYEFASQPGVQLRLYLLENLGGGKPERIKLSVLAENEWRDWMSAIQGAFPRELREEITLLNPPESGSLPKVIDLPSKTVLACLAPRGVGLTAWGGNDRKQIQMRRRFMLLGQTLDSMRVWDIRRAIQVLRSTPEWRDLPLTIEAKGQMGVNALYASLFELKSVAGLVLSEIPASHREGPDYLNVLRFLDIPQAVTMAAEDSHVFLRQSSAAEWEFPRAVAAKLGWPGDHLRIGELQR